MMLYILHLLACMMEAIGLTFTILFLPGLMLSISACILLRNWGTAKRDLKSQIILFLIYIYCIDDILIEHFTHFNGGFFSVH